MWEGDYAALGNMDLHFCSQGFDEEPQWNFYKSHILSYVKKKTEKFQQIHVKVPIL